MYKKAKASKYKTAKVLFFIVKVLIKLDFNDVEMQTSTYIRRFKT